MMISIPKWNKQEEKEILGTVYFEGENTVFWMAEGGVTFLDSGRQFQSRGIIELPVDSARDSRYILEDLPARREFEDGVNPRIGKRIGPGHKN